MTIKTKEKGRRIDGQTSELKPIEGFDDRIGLAPKMQRQVEGCMRDLFERNSYLEYIPPTIERAEVYGIGVAQDPTPWIDGTQAIPKRWEETVNREFLPITVVGFQGDRQVKSEYAILRPEGTASLCRYVAERKVEGGQLPDEANLPQKKEKLQCTTIYLNLYKE